MRRMNYYCKVMMNSFKTQYVYKAQVLSKILFCILSYLIQMYIWKSVNSASETALYNIEYMSGYVLISSMISVFVAFDMSYIPIVEAKVRSGDIGEELIIPVNFLVYNFFEYLGKCLFKCMFQVLPLCVIFFLFKVSAKVHLANTGYFLMAVMFAVSIFFLLNMICGMLSFWLFSIGNLHIIIDSSITLFSGSIIPLWLIPEKFAFVYEILPFQYLYYYPISIILGLVNVQQMVRVFLYEMIWTACLFALAVWMYNKGIKKLQIVG